MHHPVLGEEMVPVLFFPLAAVSGKPVVAQHYLLGVGELRPQDSQQVALFVVFQVFFFNLYDRLYGQEQVAVVIVEFLEVPPEGRLRYKEALVGVYVFQGIDEFCVLFRGVVADA